MIFGNAAPDPIEEFAIEFSANGPSTFLHAQGEDFGEFQVPFTAEQVHSALADYTPSRTAGDPLVAFGSTLFSALFAGLLGRRLWERFADAERHNRGLRLRILSNLERTQHLPWELLYDPSRGDFMSLSGRLALVRTRPDGFPWQRPLPALQRLRILAVSADPDALLKGEEDLVRLRAMAAAFPGAVDVQTIRNVTPWQLANALAERRFDIFHFSGTGQNLALPKRGSGLAQALTLVGIQGEPVLLDRQELGKLLQKGGVRLAVLNACDTEWVARSLAKYMPAALGFRDKVRIESCLALCNALYRAFVAGNPLDLAVTATRQALDRALPDTGDWSKLIFYLQQPTGTFVAHPDESSDVAAATPPRQESKEVAAWSRLRDVYRSNLAELERGASRSSSGAADFSTRRDELTAKIDDLSRRIDEATGQQAAPPP